MKQATVLPAENPAVRRRRRLVAPPLFTVSSVSQETELPCSGRLCESRVYVHVECASLRGGLRWWPYRD